HARRDQTGTGPGRLRGGVSLRFVLGCLRALEPRDSGTARSKPDEPQGCLGAAKRQHGARQRAVSKHCEEAVRRADRAGGQSTGWHSGRITAHVGLGRDFATSWEGDSMRRLQRGRGSSMEFGGSGEDSFVAVVVTKLTGALLFILLLAMV